MLLGGVVIGLLVLIVQFGLNPRAKPIIKPSNFSNFEMIGQTIFRQLHKDINPSHIVAFGVHQATDLQIISGLLKASQKYKRPFDMLLILNHLKVDWQDKTKAMALQVQSLNQENYASILKFLKEKQAQAQKVLLVANPEDVTHLQDQSLIGFLERDLEQPILSFVRSDCSFELEALRDLQSLCRQQSKSSTSFLHLSCLTYQKSLWLKKLKSKKVDKNKNIVFLEQYGLTDYIYFIHST